MKTVSHSGGSVVNCHTKPHIPFGHWEVVRHVNSGQIPVASFSSFMEVVGNQNGQVCPQALILKVKMFKGRWQAANSCALDFFLEHQDLIPSSWEEMAPWEKVKARRIFFLDTIFRDRTDPADLYVRFMFKKTRETWSWDYQLVTEPYDADLSVVAVTCVSPH